MRSGILTAVVFSVVAGSWASAGVIVDGNLTDWGISVADHNASDFTFSSSLNILGWHEEDQNDQAGNGGQLGPYQGGQNYDAELLAVALENNVLSIALVTGQRPDNNLEFFSPGDLRFETSLGVFGIELGGGPGGDAGDLLLSGAPGSTYVVNSRGYTTGHSWADPAQTAGSIWLDADWLFDPISHARTTQMQITPDSVSVGQADYVYTRDQVTDQHSIVELSFDLTAFSGAVIDNISWRPGCGNDELQVELGIVPEPHTAALALAGMLLVCPPRKLQRALLVARTR